MLEERQIRIPAVALKGEGIPKSRKNNTRFPDENPLNIFFYVSQGSLHKLYGLAAYKHEPEFIRMLYGLSQPSMKTETRSRIRLQV